MATIVTILYDIGTPTHYSRLQVKVMAYLGVCVFASSLFSWPAREIDMSSFSPGMLISDQEMVDKSTLSIADIQQLLSASVPICQTSVCLKSYSENGTSAATIIYSAAQTHGVNPQVLLSLIETASLLVSDVNPSTSQFSVAAGYPELPRLHHK